MNNEIKIGGEFDIDPELLNGYVDYVSKGNNFLYSSGRSALMAILQHISSYKNKIIHVPFYICPSVVKVCIDLGFKAKFYELNSNFLFPLDYLPKIGPNEILLTVNYFGCVDDNTTAIDVKANRSDILIISDQVQSYWTYDKSEADFSFTSLRKHFPILQGALIHSKKETIIFDLKMEESVFYKSKLIGSILKNQNFPDKLYLKFFGDGEQELDNEICPLKASSLAYYLFEKVDLNDAYKRRRENYSFLYQLGNDRGINFVFPYNEKATPLNVPIYTKKRDNLRRELMNHNIFTPIHWPLKAFNKSSILAQKLANYSLSLVIDQRYTLNDMKNMIQKIENFIEAK